MSIRELKRHIAELQDFLEAHTQNFWGNFGLLCFALFMWTNILPVLIAFQPYFRTDKWEDFGIWGIWLVGFMIVLIVLGAYSEQFAPTGWNFGLIILIGLWLWFVGAVRAGDPTDAPARNLTETILYATLWEYKTTLVWLSTLWLLGIFWYRLYFVHQNRNQKLSAFYWIFGTNLTIITTGYLMFAPLGFCVSLILPQKVFGAWLTARTKKDYTERGTVMEGIHNRQNQRLAKRQHERSLRKQPDLTVIFGGILLPMRQLVLGGIFVIGSVGAGKTITIRLLMQGCLPHVYLGSDKRAFVYNPKRDILPVLYSITGARIALIDPFDIRCTAIDFAASITSYAEAENFAYTLVSAIGENEHTEQFFRNAAIQLIIGATLFLINHAKGNWDLRDLILIFSSERRLRAILGSDPETVDYLNILATDKTGANILASVITEINRYRVLAALFYHAPYKISIKEWMAGGVILVCVHDDRSANMLATINRLIFTLAMQQVLSGEETFDPKHFFFLDEVQLLSLEQLDQLHSRGRSKGAVVVEGTQAIGGLYKKLGKHTTDVILGQIEHKAFLHVNDSDTCRWCAEQVGEAEINRLNATFSHKSDFGSFLGHPTLEGYTEQRVITSAVMPSEFSNIERIDPPTGQGLTGFYKSNQVWKNYYPWNKLQEQLIPPSNEPNFIEVDADKQRLPKWTEADWIRLGIYDLMKELEKQEKQKQSDTESEENTSNNASSSEFDPDAVNRRLVDLREMLRQAQNNSDDDDTDNTKFTGNGTAQEQQPTTYRQMNPEALKRRQIKKNPKQQPKNQKPNHEKDFNR